VQEIDLTGTVFPKERVDLNFEQGGKVSGVSVDVGDSVKRGQLLVSVSDVELRASLLEAQANLEFEQATLNDFVRGTREEDIEISRTKVSNAQVTANDSKGVLFETIEDTYTTADDVLKNKVDQLFNNPQSTKPELIPTTNSSSLKFDLENVRMTIKNEFSSWQNLIQSTDQQDEISFLVVESKTRLQKLRDFLEKLTIVVTEAKPSGSYSQTDIDKWRTDISSGKNTVNNLISSLSSAEDSYTTARSNLALAQRELTLKEAGTIQEQIDAQSARVKSAGARIESILAQIAKTQLRSPIDGIVVAQEAKVGEIVFGTAVTNPQGALVSIISPSNYEIRTNISEADIAKVSTDDTANIDFDAYGRDVVFKARVVKIDPAETVIDGVSTYEATLIFDEQDERIRSGLTANIVIETNRAENVLAIPSRLVYLNKDGDRMVRVLREDGTVEDIVVTVGIRGFDGYIEIISGINELDKVLTEIE
jgi:RND family efflux transporter MFP subunit